MCLPPLLFVRLKKNKRPQSVPGQRSLIEYGSNAKSAELSKEMDVCASQRTHP